MKKNIPNFITLLNLVSGTLGIIFILQGRQDLSIYMILLAALFDFLDGTAARALKAYSKIGKSLDSLSDMISFGVLPGLLVYSIAAQSLPVSRMDIVASFSILIPVFGAIRLAVFENDESQKENFRGLPVPANAIFIAALSQVFWYEPGSFIYLGPFGYFFIALIFSAFQIIFIPVLGLKFKSLNLRENLSRYIVILVSLVLILLLKWEGVLISIPFYLLVSLFRKF